MLALLFHMDILISLFLIFYVDFIYIETLSEAWMHNILCKPLRFIIKWFLYCFEDICSSEAQTADEVAEDKPADSIGSLIMTPSRDFSSMNERRCSLTRSLTD